MRHSPRAGFAPARPSVLSVVDQLAAAEPSSSLPVIVSAASRALGVDRLCVHLLSHAEPPILRRFAAVGMPESLLAVNAELPVGRDGGPVGLAAESGSVVVEQDVRHNPAWIPVTRLGQLPEVLSCWAVPIVGKDGILGVVSGYGATTGPPRPDLVELVFLYAGYVAAAIERARLRARANGSVDGARAGATRVLLVDDDRKIVDLVRSNLEVRGYEVTVSTDGSEVLWRVEAERPDLVLLDLGQPGADGFELCRQIRERAPVGIIIVSARRGEHVKVQALNLGADDYMTKPFGVEELMARITATLRRTGPAPVPVAEPTVAVGDVVVDLDAQAVTRAGEMIHLTPTEFSLLRELVLHRGKLLSHATLLRRVWGPGYETETEYIRVYVRRLRSKLESPGGPSLITTEPRVGIG